MIERFTDRVRKTMALANQEAWRLGHGSIGTEHILLGLIAEGGGVGVMVLKQAEIDLGRLRREIEKQVRAGPASTSPHRVEQGAQAKQAVVLAIEESRRFGHNYVGSEHLLLGLLGVHEGIAAQVLSGLGIGLEAARRTVVELLGDDEAQAEAPVVPTPEPLEPACPICSGIERIRRAEHPGFIAELGETYVVLGDNQGLRGWCVLLLKGHREHLADLDVARQCRIFGEVALVAQTIREVVSPRRINYECLGNLVPHIHWHIIPRHADDPEPTKAVWGFTPERLRGTMSDGERADLIAAFRRALG